MTMGKGYGMVFAMLLMAMVSAAEDDVSRGRASYYSDRSHGRLMSDGTAYHRDSMTCAHLGFPLGTLLKVRNPMNGKQVIVKVTDRGPFTKRYIIDLSLAAAKELGFIRAGFCQVEITPYHENEIPYRPKDDVEEIPELDLQYTVVATYPTPAWQRDSLTAKAPAGPSTSDSLPRKGKGGNGN